MKIDNNCVISKTFLEFYLRALKFLSLLSSLRSRQERERNEEKDTFICKSENIAIGCKYNNNKLRSK